MPSWIEIEVSTPSGSAPPGLPDGGAVAKIKINNPYLSVSPTSSKKTTMGIQSQLRNGSIKTCKKKATTVKYKWQPLARMETKARLPFIPELHCQLCRIRAGANGEEKAKAYKKGHREGCPRKPLKKEEKNNNTLLNYAARNGMASEVAKVPPMPPPHPTDDKTNAGAYMMELSYPLGSIRPAYVSETTTPDEARDNSFVRDTHYDAKSEQKDFVQDIKDAVSLKMTEIHQGIDEQKKDLRWAVGTSVPTVMMLAADDVVSRFDHRRKQSSSGILPATPQFLDAIGRYYEFFPMNSCTFQFPRDSTGSPCPYYHQVEGEKLIYLDWQLSFPQLLLPCPCCHEQRTRSPELFLVHDRTNFKKTRSMFPIWNFQGNITWSIVMSYSCPHCKQKVRGNDGRLLALLPAHVRATYPVPPRYATGSSFHLHNDLVAFLETSMKTYANANFVSTHLVQSMGRQYAHKVETYLSQLVDNQPDYPTWEELQKTWPPAAATLRSLYEEAEHSVLQPYGFSNVERYIREGQSVTLTQSDVVAFDHTFQALKSYSSTRGNAIFTGCKGKTKEIVSLAIVPSTKLFDVSHLLQQSTRRRTNFKPGVVYTDTIPNGERFWKEVFGPEVDCRLGLFHFLHRIVDTLNTHSKLY